VPEANPVAEPEESDDDDADDGEDPPAKKAKADSDEVNRGIHACSDPIVAGRRGPGTCHPVLMIMVWCHHLLSSGREVVL